MRSAHVRWEIRMKVVLFCGGLGMRIREAGEGVPKPMVTIGYRPILWHVMKYYAHFGHKDFVLCLGYRGDVIKNYFLEYSECLSNDFVLSEGGKKLDLMASDIHDWKITFVETGLHANIGQRLQKVEQIIGDDEEFLANYSDGLTDLSLAAQIEHFRRHGAVASFASVKPNLSYHIVSADPDGLVTAIEDIRQAPVRINGGFFVFRREIFRHLRDGEELVHGPFHELMGSGRLRAYHYDGFWMSMDTFKDRQQLEDIYARGNAPWQVWNGSEPGTTKPAIGREEPAATRRPASLLPIDGRSLAY
jgi:glucose-1-phosphate cytidylyltransferase